MDTLPSSRRFVDVFCYISELIQDLLSYQNAWGNSTDSIIYPNQSVGPLFVTATVSQPPSYYAGLSNERTKSPFGNVKDGTGHFICLPSGGWVAGKISFLRHWSVFHEDKYRLIV